MAAVADQSVKLDNSNLLVDVGLGINKVPFGYAVAMRRYETELLEYCEVTEGPVVCPKLSDMFVTVDSTQLDSMQAKHFHTVVAKLLYLAKRVRPDILTVGRVLNMYPTEYDLQLL